MYESINSYQINKEENQMKKSKILIISTESDAHLHSVCKELDKRNIRWVKFFPENLPYHNLLTYKFDSENGRFSLSGNIDAENNNIDLKNIRSVWFRKPLTHKISPDLSEKGIIEFAKKETENSLTWLYKILQCKWVNNPIQMYYIKQKSYQLKVASEIGLDIPKSLITNNPQDVIDFFKECNGQVAIKPLSPPAVATTDGVCGLYTHKIEKKDLLQIDFVKYAPCFLQEYIPKKTELRITVVGDKIFACEIESQVNEDSKYDWRKSNEVLSLPHRLIKLPFDIENKCMKLTKKLGILFGAIDIIKTPNDQYVFLEINPNGQWLWIEELTGAKISSAIADLLVTC